MATTVFWTSMPTPLGEMVLASVPAGLAGAWFAGQKHFAGVAPQWRESRDGPHLGAAREQLEEWFAGGRTGFALALAPRGSPFQQAVWEAIAAIGFGQTREYGSLATALGMPGAARAVGAATGRNPLSIIVPCHRLLGAGGQLTGYAGGLERKRALLDFERQGRLEYPGLSPVTGKGSKKATEDRESLAGGGGSSSL